MLVPMVVEAEEVGVEAVVLVVLTPLVRPLLVVASTLSQVFHWFVATTYFHCEALSHVALWLPLQP